MTEAILARARAGDVQAFGTLTDPYRGELQLHCYRILGLLVEAEDMLQGLRGEVGVLRACRGECCFGQRDPKPA